MESKKVPSQPSTSMSTRGAALSRSFLLTYFHTLYIYISKKT